MDSRRFITFLILCFAFSYLYSNFILPPKKPVLPPAAKQADDGAGEDAVADVAGEDADSGEKQDEPPAFTIASHPERTIELGSDVPDDQYALKAVLTSKGASIQSVTLTDPKFKDLKDHSKQAQILGTTDSLDQTMGLAVDLIDRQLKKEGLSLETIHWELISSSVSKVVFSVDAPDGSMTVRKTFFLDPLDVNGATSLKKAYLNQPSAFTIKTEIQLVSKTEKEQELQYELQGPVGVLLENKDHTRKFRDIKLEFYDNDDAVTLSAAELSETYEEQQEERKTQERLTEVEIRAALRQSDAWTRPYRYAGVDVQFFAALVTPLDKRTPEEQALDRWVERIYPVLEAPDALGANYKDLSFRIVSAPITLSGEGDTVTHEYEMFVGPKRRDLLEPEPFVADEVLDYGSWFGFIARVMHTILDTFYGLGMPYFLAIISLTVLVRGMMFPISRKQAVMAAKQKALAPKINELKLKYGDDKEKIARAQMELWRKHGINPLGGCLPIFIQFPVFIALYTCLNTAIDLRLAQFLWVDNLAAPDALFTMPKLPFLGSDFNLLPCVTVVLFLVQQKLFMPPPADEQAELTQKMMNFMMIGMGIMFWHVPAGLCIYFIASSLWGIAERKLLKVNVKAPEESSVTVKAPGEGSSDEAAPKKGFWARKMEAMQEKMQEVQEQAEKAQKASSSSRPGKQNKRRSGKDGGKGKKKKRR